MPDQDDARRYRTNLQGEVDGAALYQAMADAEQDPKISEVYSRLASVERAHGEFWAKRLETLKPGGRPLTPTMRARALAWLARRFGPSFVLPTVAAGEARDSTQYDKQPEAAAAGLPSDERSHRRIVQAVEEASGGLPGSTIAALEGRHRSGSGNALRAAVLGANDGLVSNTSLVMGVAGAIANSHTLLLTGLAGLVAGACSMAMGEWLSVTSSRELYERQIASEAGELKEAPEEEREELVLIYEAKGLPKAQAEALADRLLSNEETALDTLAREELGVDPKELGGSPWQAAGASFSLFALGAFFPVAPFFFLQGTTAVIASLVSAGAALAAIGAATSLFTGKHPALAALRQLVIGYLAAAVTFGAGKALGVAVS
jgi:VIT1/CCC1 family predicted Fe2+/Mn2+ transporter